jgi:DNA (cytosine-5)-methyltransferase 1
MIRVGSVCSGIGAPERAWSDLGWRFVFASEIEAFPRAVLAHRFPTLPVHGDFTTIKAGDDESIDLLVGGTPCQSFSVAGLRAGMADERGNLALEYLRLADRLRPRWVVWENVPGVLSSNEGRDFGAFVGGLGQLGYGFAYRVLDAQHFGVPQRRRRVFVVGYLGDWRPAAAVLFERESLLGNPAPRRKEGQNIAALIATGVGACGADNNQAQAGHLLALCLNAKGGSGRMDAESKTLIAHTLRGDGFDASEDGTGRGTPLVAHAFDARQSNVIQYGNKTGPLDTCGNSVGVMAHASAAVRRLTPRECERLQGFPDDWTLVPYRGKPAADGPRYKALGNSMAVPVMRWIGERIALADRATQSAAPAADRLAPVKGRLSSVETCPGALAASGSFSGEAA